jgi:hypothetical protein
VWRRVEGAFGEIDRAAKGRSRRLRTVIYFCEITAAFLSCTVIFVPLDFAAGIADSDWGYVVDGLPTTAVCLVAATAFLTIARGLAMARRWALVAGLSSLGMLLAAELLFALYIVNSDPVETDPHGYTLMFLVPAGACTVTALPVLLSTCREFHPEHRGAS